MKVDFGDFQFMRIEPKVVRYVSGIATALLGSEGFSTVHFPFFKPYVILRCPDIHFWLEDII